MTEQEQATHRENAGQLSPEHAEQLAEVAARREPVATIGEEVEYFDTLLLDIDWLAWAAVQAELDYARAEQAMRRSPLPVIGLPDVRYLAETPSIRPVVVEPGRRSTTRRNAEVERLADNGNGFIEYAVDTDTISGERALVSTTVFDRGWDQMPGQKYAQFYDVATGCRLREAHILYDNSSRTAKMMDIFFHPETGQPAGYRQIEANLHVAAPGRIPAENPFLTTGQGELTSLRHHLRPEKHDGDHAGEGRGAQETITICDKINRRSPTSEMKMDYHYGKMRLPPCDLHVVRVDPLSGMRFATVDFKFEKRNDSRSRPRELPQPKYPAFGQLAAKSLIRVAGFSFYNFQTGAKEAEVRCESL